MSNTVYSDATSFSISTGNQSVLNIASDILRDLAEDCFDVEASCLEVKTHSFRTLYLIHTHANYSGRQSLVPLNRLFIHSRSSMKPYSVRTIQQLIGIFFYTSTDEFRVSLGSISFSFAYRPGVPMRDNINI
ncbi:MAG: hypothetical protein EXX96DRAFT_621224 [Benjaminiella poitrasii]|nr:MAG: hypothetical protein EXX96DRAFT_621224 [Benjaminiella poitrasii]